MNDWQRSLDKYLTSEPNDGFNNWVELLVDELNDETYLKHEDWLLFSSESSEWFGELFDRGYNPQKGAEIIERILKYKI